MLVLMLKKQTNKKKTTPIIIENLYETVTTSFTAANPQS